MLAVVDLGFGFSICSDRAKAAAAAALARALCTGSGPLLLLLLFLTGAADGACALGFADDGALLLLIVRRHLRIGDVDMPGRRCVHLRDGRSRHISLRSDG